MQPFTKMRKRKPRRVTLKAERDTSFYIPFFNVHPPCVWLGCVVSLACSCVFVPHLCCGAQNITPCWRTNLQENAGSNDCEETTTFKSMKFWKLLNFSKQKMDPLIFIVFPRFSVWELRNLHYKQKTFHRKGFHRKFHHGWKMLYLKKNSGNVKLHQCS